MLKCHFAFSDLDDALDEEIQQNQNSSKDDLRARKVGEVLHSSVSKLALVVDFPREIIKDVARPSYWVADADIVTCACCNYRFRVIDSKHHCRACGHGVCGKCSSRKRAVPVRGWEYPVRVCDKCVEGMTQSTESSTPRWNPREDTYSTNNESPVSETTIIVDIYRQLSLIRF
jgi:zinc finger FYVE domain-containing protein 1